MLLLWYSSYHTRTNTCYSYSTHLPIQVQNRCRENSMWILVQTPFCIILAVDDGLFAFRTWILVLLRRWLVGCCRHGWRRWSRSQSENEETLEKGRGSCPHRAAWRHLFAPERRSSCWRAFSVGFPTMYRPSFICGPLFSIVGLQVWKAAMLLTWLCVAQELHVVWMRRCYCHGDRCWDRWWLAMKFSEWENWLIVVLVQLCNFSDFLFVFVKVKMLCPRSSSMLVYIVLLRSSNLL